MKCARCGHSLNPVSEDGWTKCPKCKLSKFIGKVSKSQKKREESLKKADSPTLPGADEPASEGEKTEDKTE